MSGLMSVKFESRFSSLLAENEIQKEFDLSSIRLESVSRIKQALSVGRLNATELALANFQLSRLENATGASVRMESSKDLQQNLTLRCEGIISGLYETVKKFIAWLCERIKNIFTGSTSPGGSATSTFERDIPAAKERGPLKAFKAGELNNYFSYATEGEAMTQINEVVKNVEHIDHLALLLYKVPFADYMKPDCTLDLQVDLPTIFVNKVLGAAIDIDNAMVNLAGLGGKGQGFEITPKLVLALKPSDDHTFKMMKLPVDNKVDCADINVYYDLITGIGKMLNKTCAFVSKWNTYEINNCQKKLNEVNTAKEHAPADNALVLKNIMLVGSVWQQWMLFLLELDHLVHAMNKTLNRLESN